ncbi:MAG: amidohydrolase family protein [Phycisphaerae bacterium]|jgi:putative selenium metabolism protein SsnA
MRITLTNALLCDLDPPRVERGALRVADGRIAARGTQLTPQSGEETVDCGGAVVLPGLVNGHTHLYSALAVGMPPPPRPPQDFLEILKLVWWRLDRALDAESIELSARIGALEALRCGTTTLIDHHASPNHIGGSLELVERGIDAVGLRAVLCYEATDRHGDAGREAGLAENRRYLQRCANRSNGRFAAMVGAHASFTLEDDSLAALASLAEEFQAGVHIHVAEDPCDEARCQQHDQVFLIDRLAAHGLLRPESIFAHCTHLDEEAIARVSNAGLTVAHNARSNMNNAVGYAPVAAFRCPVMLGTDGLGADLFAEAKAAWLVSRHETAGLAPADVLAMLAAGARRASVSLGVTLGKLEPDAAADVVITDYVPATPLTAENLSGHFLFGLSSRHVRDVIVDGAWRMRDRECVGLDEHAVRADAQRAAAALWQRMADMHA